MTEIQDNQTPLLDPKEVQIELPEGGAKTFIISKIPALPAREIMNKLYISTIPKIGDYEMNAEMFVKMMGYVAIPIQAGRPQRLLTPILINNHIPNWVVADRLEKAMKDYNYAFFFEEKISTIFEGIAEKLQQAITKTLTDFSGPLSLINKPPSTN